MTRGHRLTFDFNSTHLFYACKENLVARGWKDELKTSVVYTGHQDQVTCVSISRAGNQIAIGDVKGCVTILTFNGSVFEKKKEHFLIKGDVNDILWAQDDKFVVAVGVNGSHLGACNPESGSRVGEIFGVAATALCGTLVGKNNLYTAGEGKELLKHAFPYKGQGVQVKHPHDGFVNQIRASPDSSKFATVSADKSICVFNAADDTVLKHYTKAHAMGIYDLWWLDDSSFMTCSADNNVKVWQLDQDAAVKELTQGDAKRDVSRQMLAIAKIHDNQTFGFNLSGDLCFWNKDGEFSSMRRHCDYIQSLLSFNGDMYYSSTSQVFHIHEHSISKIEASFKNNVKNLSCNSHSFYGTDLDRVLIRFADNKEDKKITLPKVAMCVTADDAHVYVLTMDSNMMVLDAKDLSVKKEKKCGYDATAMDNQGGNLWVSDKKGHIHVHDIASLDEKHKSEKAHQKPPTIIAGNSKFVASCDAYREVWVWNAASNDLIDTFGTQKDTIMDCYMNEELMLTVSHNKDYVLRSLSDMKVLKHESNVHESRHIQQAVLHQNHIVSHGRDCALRQIPL
jgi:WD40 repeat protein